MGAQGGKKYICMGILAHVDAGKTTLSESILYTCGNIRKLGRVDHKDAFLDTYSLERDRGITIFSKQAVFDLGEKRVTLLDTPGHVDFSAEMERTLQVLDYAILVISGADGVQGHTKTLWNLLKHYQIPTFIFVNKMDQDGTDRAEILSELKKKLDSACVDIEDLEDVATCDEQALEEYLEHETISTEMIQTLIGTRRLFPCYFGSALKLQGIQEFIDGLDSYMKLYETLHAEYISQGTSSHLQETRAEGNPRRLEFGARVYKISRTPKGERLTHLKITSGSLKVKELVSGIANGESWEEKADQIRIYSGDKFEMVNEAYAGMVCAITGLSLTAPGDGLGIEPYADAPMLEPVLNYQLLYPDSFDTPTVLRYLRQLEEEEPMLRVVWKEEPGEIHVQLMGEVQTEILQSLMQERYGIPVTFGIGNIVYKETIRTTVEGVGHFEPLRHYAEVHLILEPGEGGSGSGLVFDTVCSEDVLDKNWQRLILTHLAETEHPGVLIGAPITDMKITLIAGRAHLKHTEGGDFRQSTYRAVRQGLMQAENVLLEPYYEFSLEIPSEHTGRALTDIQRMYGEFATPQTEGDLTLITGTAPVATMCDYPKEVINYTRGRGRLSLVFYGYLPCHNQETVIEAAAYNPDADQERPTGSVFCAHGAGYYVPWQEVPEHMHIPGQLEKYLRADSGDGDTDDSTVRNISTNKANGSSGGGRAWNAEDQELEEIFIRTYGKVERKPGNVGKSLVGESKPRYRKPEEKVPEYLLVDGYNVIFSWEELRELAKVNIESARDKLMDIVSNYQGFKKCTVILVFDAYKVEGNVMVVQKYHNIHVVYTKHAETADQYIEKVVHEIGKKYHVTVVTSDGVEQVITTAQGSNLISSREFEEEVANVRRQIAEEIESRKAGGKNYLFDHMEEELAKEMEDIRLGRKEELQ